MLTTTKGHSENNLITQERGLKSSQADASDVLGLRLLTANSSDSPPVSLGGEFLRRSIFSMPWIGDSNMRQSMSAAKNVRQTCDKVSPS